MRQEGIGTICEVSFQAPLITLEESLLHLTITDKPQKLQQLRMNMKLKSSKRLLFHTVKIPL